MSFPLGGTPTPQQAAYLQNLRAATSHVPGSIRRTIQDAALASQRTVTSLPYWSTVRFQAARAGAYTYSISAGTSLKAFSYGIGGNAVGAGFASSVSPTLAETNLTKASETLDNADVFIWGLAFEICPGGMPDLAAAIWRNTSVQLSLSGTDTLRVGTLHKYPSAGGLFGVAPSVANAGFLNSPQGVDLSYLQNGNPMGGNFGRFSQAFRWNAAGSAAKDTSLVISLTVENAISITGADRVAVAGAAPGASGQVTAFTAATQAEAYLDVRCYLISESLSHRSQNI
jgi:hypothetical protein